MVYPIFETFHSWQGEGEHLGRSAFFIRLYGCPLRCDWCDSAGTWKGDGKSADLDAHALAETAAAARPDFVVVTGGEPAIHDLAPLADALHEKNLRVHVETSGAFEIRGNVDWVTLSPKPQRPPLAENWARADEIKLIVTKPEDIGFWEERIGTNSARSIWLHPEWSRREDAEVLDAISAHVRARGAPFRAGWQMHKLFGVR